MKSKRNVFIFIICAFTFVSGFGAVESYGQAGSGSRKKIYQMTWNGDNVAGKLYVNGFLIGTFAGARAAGTEPLNVWLVGDNEIRAELKKARKSEGSYFTFGVSELYRGDTASTGDRGNLLSVETKDGDFSGGKVVKISRKFRSSVNFSGRFIGTGAAKEKDVIEYAKKIYDLVAKKDKAGISKEFAPKIEDYTKTFAVNETYDEFKSSLVDSLIGMGRLEKINPARLRAKKVGPGNTWHVVEGNREFIRSKSSEGGMSSQMVIFIGIVNGALKVIR